ncbi:signal recognition particle receptor subunit beta [Microplitis demolitor]|uniref:signal recognition particle receptor subunit beta n=1 Tax=Microplitis demolitor TaxID=69319 RepID=UPI0004CD0090|nr:signal recognition particle receptor subunit beta [Microplitis demolitor]
MEQTNEFLNETNVFSQYIGIIIAIFVIILSLVFFTWRRRKSAGRSILLTGLSDAGKTLLYARLVHDKFIETYTSAKENIGDIDINDKSLQVVDIPGHERLRYKFIDKYKTQAIGLIYVIDSVSIQKDIRDVTEFLYNILSDSKIQKIPVLILCNKQDQTMAKGSAVIKTMIEKEMNLVRVTKSNQLEATDATTASSFIGIQGKDFEFSHLNIKIEFAESSAFDKESDTSADIVSVNDWLKKIT